MIRISIIPSSPSPASPGSTQIVTADGWPSKPAAPTVFPPKRSGSAPPAAISSKTISPGATTRPNLCPTMRPAGRPGPNAVARYAPNAFGLYDICDNVHEWCSDWYDPNYYAISPERNPRGPEPQFGSGQRKASRGGSWRHHVKVSRCSARSSIPPDFHYADYGFRVACDR